MQKLARAVARGHFGWAVEAVKVEFHLIPRIGVVGAHPLDQFAGGFQAAEVVAEAGFLDFVVRRWAAAGDVLLYQMAAGEAAFDGDCRVAMLFDQALEEAVAEEEEIFAAVERFAEAEQFDGVAESGDQIIDGGVERFGGIEREGDCFALDPVVESRLRSVQHGEPVSGIIAEVDLISRRGCSREGAKTQRGQDISRSGRRERGEATEWLYKETRRPGRDRSVIVISLRLCVRI